MFDVPEPNKVGENRLGSAGAEQIKQAHIKNNMDPFNLKFYRMSLDFGLQ